MFNELKEGISGFLSRLGYDFKKVFFTPISAKAGENIIKKSGKMKWFDGDYLSNAVNKSILAPEDETEKQFTGLIQDVYDVEGNKVIITKIESGSINAGEEIIFNLCGLKDKIKAIRVYGEERDSADAGENVGLEFDNIDFKKVKKGEVISKKELNVSDKVTAKIFLLIDESLKEKDNIEIRCGTAERKAFIEKIIEKFDSSTTERIKDGNKIINPAEVSSVTIKLSEPIAVERFDNLPSIGRFLITKENKIIAIGIVTDKK